MKWIAYLNLKQKLKSLGLLSVVLLISLGFILYVYEQDFMYKYKNQLGANEHYLLLNMGGKIIYLLSFSFILIYAGSCVLVLLFNLPTSSVFEQKFGEVLNFQRLSHSVKMGINESQIYDLLLEGSMNTVLADAAWLDIYDSDGDHEIIQSLRQNINTKESQELRSLIRENQPRIRGDIVLIKNLRKLGTDEGDAIYKYKSLLGIPLQTYNKNIGTLYLVKKIKDGFDKELLEVLATFVGQASMSLENNRLISEAIENERYKEELKIATSVQQSLLPQDLISSPYFEIGALSIPATEVGGDYYDVFELTSEQVAIVIGDVSGHGTKAAFHMAQLKGVFQSLISLKLTPSEFMIHANQALGRCLEKNIFVTLSLFIIDLKDKTINYSRAGHCPTLFFSKETLKTEYLESEGLGLGILRNDSYNKHAKAYTFEYKPGDIMVLYTDGIVEAKNKNGQEFDFHRLRSIVKKENALGADDLVSKINNELIKFCDTEEMDDDRTMVVIKFHS